MVLLQNSALFRYLLTSIEARRLEAQGIDIRDATCLDDVSRLDVVCLDKTGVLTTLDIRVGGIHFAGEMPDAASFLPALRDERGTLTGIACALCNDVFFLERRHQADPIDRALITFALQHGFDIDQLAAQYTRVYDKPFDSEDRYMAAGFAALDKWTHATSLLSEQLRTLLEKRKASRAVKIVFPLEFDSITFLPRKAIVSLADEISRSESGHRPIPIRKKQGMLEWQPIPVLDAKTLMPYESVKVENTAMVGFAFAFQKYILEEDHNELFLKSLRNTLNKKQKQQLGSHPYLLTLRLGHHSMQVKGVVAATQERIWPNPKYEWLTGLLIFTPAIAFRKSDPPPTLNYSFNPNARTAPPRSLIELFAAQRRFHLRNGEYYQE